MEGSVNCNVVGMVLRMLLAYIRDFHLMSDVLAFGFVYDMASALLASLRKGTALFERGADIQALGIHL